MPKHHSQTTPTSSGNSYPRSSIPSQQFGISKLSHFHRKHGDRVSLEGEVLAQLATLHNPGRHQGTHTPPRHANPNFKVHALLLAETRALANSASKSFVNVTNVT